MRIGLFVLIFVFNFFHCVFLFGQSEESLSNRNGRIPKDSFFHPHRSGIDYSKNRDSLFIDFLNHETTYLERDEKGLIIFDRSWEPLDLWQTFKDTIFYDPSFLPVVFDGKLLPEDLSFIRDDKYTAINYHLIEPDSTLLPYIDKYRRIKQQRINYYTQINNINKIKYSEAKFNRLSRKRTEEVNIPKKNIIQELISAEKPLEIHTPEIQPFVPKRRYWRKQGEHSLQIAQNYISDNWYKGGASSYYVQSYEKFLLNYAKSKFTLNNTFEWKLGFQSASGDTLREIRVNNDVFRTYTLAGYKAYNNWSYSASLETITQLFNMYPENSTKRKSSFLSPLDVNLGLGMSYSIDKKFENNNTKNIKLSLNLAPLSMNFRYIMDDKVDETSFKLDEGRSTKTSWGSLVNADMTFNFSSFLVWTSRFKYLTDYESVVSELENKFDFSLNRYFSTSVYVYLRYDETSKKDDDLKYLQINELVSFGLNYKW